MREKTFKKYKASLRELQDNMKCNNIQIIGRAEREEKGQEIKTCLKK